MYTLLEQAHLNAPRNLPSGPLLGASLLTALDHPVPFRGHAIKYVLHGAERYTVNGRPFTIRGGHYLAANPHSTGRINIDSHRTVRGLCADLPAALIDGMVAACTCPDDLDRATLGRFFNSAEFLENSYPGGATRTGALMHALAIEVHADPHHPHTVQSGTYLRLAEAYVLDHQRLVPLLKRVKAARTSTRKEVLRGLERAKDLIRGHLDQTIGVESMAREAGISVFHFFRAFRSVHGTTPHQYHNDLRLEQAVGLLHAGERPIADVAMRCGFPDKSAFSKAFKKKFGRSPSALIGGSGRI